MANTNRFLMLVALTFGLAHAWAAEPPEVSHDGLHRVANAAVAISYRKPDVDFSGYSKVMLLDVHIAFKKNWKRDHRGINNKDMERIKRRGADLFRQTFVDVLEEGGYPVVYEAGEDVLLLRPALIDLDVKAPDVMKPGRTRTYAATAGAVTLYLEVFDSFSGEILARAADRKGARNYSNGWRMTGTSVHGSAEARRIFKAWANLLKDRLDEVRGGK